MSALSADNEAVRARVVAQPVNKADLNRMILERCGGPGGGGGEGDVLPA